MNDIPYQTKLLISHVAENQDKYATNELDFHELLIKTDELYKGIRQGKDKSANEYLPDGDLLALETEIVRQSTRLCQLNDLSFEPRKFSAQTRNFFGMENVNENVGESLQKDSPMLWTQLGEYSKEFMNTVPEFDFIYGTFDPDPIERVQKKRKQTIKDKIADLTRPLEVDQSEASVGQDIMCDDAAKILSCFLKLAQKSKNNAVCFYEFIIDPTSFSRTVEYGFLVSLLVQHGELLLFEDDEGYPWLKKVESKVDNASKTASQTALSISIEEWEGLIKTFNLTTPVIPERTLKNP